MSPRKRTAAREIGAYSANLRHHGPDDERTRSSLNAAQYEVAREQIRRAVQSAPTLTGEQKTRLAALVLAADFVSDQP